MPATTRRQLNVRLPSDILEQIEADGRAKQDVVADALRAWFDDSSENGGGRGDDSTVIADDSRNDSTVLSNDSSMIAALTGQLGEKDRQIAAKDRQLDAKDRQISELHVLMLQPQLPPAPGVEAQAEEGGRRWWQVWKR